MRCVLMMPLVCALLCQGCTVARAQSLAVTHRSTVSLPDLAADQHGESFTIAGMSGIAYAGPSPVGRPGLHRFLVVMDNSNHLLPLDAAIGPSGSITSATVVSALSLSASADFEDIVILDSGGVLLCEEGAPSIRSFNAFDGSGGAITAAPEVFASRRDNFGFESLCLDGALLWTANEEALAVDGPLSTQSDGTLVRLLRYDFISGVPIAGAQYPYICEPRHGSNITGARSGLVAIAVLPSGRMLALERSFAFNLGGFFRSRLFEVSLDSASEVSALPSLDGASFTSAAKSQLWSGNLNNLEGLCVGPVLENGGRALIGIVDDGDPISTNAIVSFQISGPTEAPCPADADASGGVAVADIFTFLSWWFAGDSRADLDAAPGIGVPDIFFFLSLWFAGCA